MQMMDMGEYDPECDDVAVYLRAKLRQVLQKRDEAIKERDEMRNVLIERQNNNMMKLNNARPLRAEKMQKWFCCGKFVFAVHLINDTKCMLSEINPILNWMKSSGFLASTYLFEVQNDGTVRNDSTTYMSTRLARLFIVVEVPSWLKTKQYEADCVLHYVIKSDEALPQVKRTNKFEKAPLGPKKFQLNLGTMHLHVDDLSNESLYIGNLIGQREDNQDALLCKLITMQCKDVLIGFEIHPRYNFNVSLVLNCKFREISHGGKKYYLFYGLFLNGCFLSYELEDGPIFGVKIYYNTMDEFYQILHHLHVNLEAPIILPPSRRNFLRKVVDCERNADYLLTQELDQQPKPAAILRGDADQAKFAECLQRQVKNVIDFHTNVLPHCTNLELSTAYLAFRLRLCDHELVSDELLEKFTQIC